MSETQPEPQTEPDVPFEEPELVEPDEPDAEPETDEDPDTDPAGLPEDGDPEETPEPEPQGMSEKELEKAFKALGKLRETNAGRVSTIMGEDALLLVPCPTCAEVAPGFVWPPEVAPPTEEAAAGMRALLGIGGPRQLKRHTQFQTCGSCDGEGFIDTGSHREGYESATCPNCSGKGYLSHGELPLPAPTNGTTEYAPVVTGPSIGELDLPPEALALREAGWFVSPPIVPVPTSQLIS